MFWLTTWSIFVFNHTVFTSYWMNQHVSQCTLHLFLILFLSINLTYVTYITDHLLVDYYEVYEEFIEIKSNFNFVSFFSYSPLVDQMLTGKVQFLIDEMLNIFDKHAHPTKVYELLNHRHNDSIIICNLLWSSAIWDCTKESDLWKQSLDKMRKIRSNATPFLKVTYMVF